MVSEVPVVGDHSREIKQVSTKWKKDPNPRFGLSIRRGILEGNLEKMSLLERREHQLSLYNYLRDAIDDYDYVTSQLKGVLRDLKFKFTPMKNRTAKVGDHKNEINRVVLGGTHYRADIDPKVIEEHLYGKDYYHLKPNQCRFGMSPVDQIKHLQSLKRTLLDTSNAYNLTKRAKLLLAELDDAFPEDL
jgi:hypothetical protein